jgi:FeS assembly protein IscX
LGIPAPGANPDPEDEMKWIDTRDIAIALAEKFPEVDPTALRFTELRQWVMELDGFDDDPSRSGEKILEAIQATWMEESDFS